jgi:hypothetical protein
MVARILQDDRDRHAWVAFVAAQPLPLTVTAIKGARRSLPQNSTLHLWTGQIAAETGQSQAEAKAEIKLRFGLPIMERDNPAWVAKWEPLYGPLPHHMRLRLFEALPLTSLLTTRQMAELMDAIQKEYLAQGISLVDPTLRRLEQMYGK